MRPIVLTNAFRRPRGSRTSVGVTVSEDTNVYACVEELIDIIFNEVGASPIMLPTLHDKESVERLAEHIDGVLLPGAISNIHPRCYHEPWAERPQTFDEAHDATDIFLVDLAKTRGLPFFGICRSMQAMNIAFGGSLQQNINGKSSIDHKCSYPCDGRTDSPEYMHEARVESGGVLANVFRCARVSVNSMHEQAVGRLGDGLRIEARADDGVIEAISWPESPNFFVGVQWHPEAMPRHEVSQKLFSAFGEDVQKRFRRRQGRSL